MCDEVKPASTWHSLERIKPQVLVSYHRPSRWVDGISTCLDEFREKAIVYIRYSTLRRTACCGYETGD